MGIACDKQIISSDSTDTYGSFIPMKILQATNAAKMQKKLKESNMVRLSLEIPTKLDLSNMMKPRDPNVNKKLLANPSMMY